ncbi:uncharacterized protein DUF1858 [Arcticibacter pallidicorallinus]|uniref:Uncharacterized protein DUF1858 n=1 Tax=Arcticibacter pallidicorallinus TaxID=1259464 RepID=A0A2T0U596_9SPHI|nr:DUF2249 domain-containing protein [Arcticibacter pallidicorallinus]PRY53089.1 uncharacterized protein DUF1858 [Arcticibacter pallidicorallinus]
MVITRKTPIAELLKVDKDAVIRQLVELNPNFARLKNPLLRNTLARMVNIESACNMAGCEIAAFLDAMKHIGFVVQDQATDTVQIRPQATSAGRLFHRELDVRPILAQKEDPIKLILQTIHSLSDEHTLKLIAPFEPIPLIHMLSGKGYAHSVQQEEGSFITYFWKDPNAAKSQATPSDTQTKPRGADFESLALKYKDRLRTIDVRNLEMPQPMIMILENLQQMPDDEALFVYHKKLPVYLLPHLQERGYEHSTQPTEDGKMNLIIYKP